jgi:hypothetical protein
LYDLKTDRTELHDLADERRDIVASLVAEYDRWAQRCGVAPFDQLPYKSSVVPWYRLPPSERAKLQKW